MKVGVFDSGVGGLSIAKKIEKEIKGVEVISRNDKANLPYGDKTPEQLIKLALPILKKMEDDGCEIIVVACNTLSMTIAEEIRAQLSSVVITVEPMIAKTVELTESKTITVCATPATLASRRYKDLLERYAQHLTVIEPDCSDWARLIEENEINEQLIADDIEPSIGRGSDVIVLGCTHYHWIEGEINELVGERAIVLQPEEYVVGRLRKAVEQLR